MNFFVLRLLLKRVEKRKKSTLIVWRRGKADTVLCIGLVFYRVKKCSEQNHQLQKKVDNLETENKSAM